MTGMRTFGFCLPTHPTGGEKKNRLEKGTKT
jgi:hypothetical protein